MTTRNITFLVGDPYKPSFTTVTVRGPYSTFTLQKTNMTIAGKPTMNESMYFLLKYGGFPASHVSFRECTWRIIPFNKWLTTMVIVSPQFLGLFPFQMAFVWLIDRGDPKYLQVLGSHPPSTPPKTTIPAEECQLEDYFPFEMVPFQGVCR